MKKFLIYTLLMFFSVTLLFSGCSKKETESDTNLPPLKSEDLTIEDINGIENVGSSLFIGDSSNIIKAVSGIYENFSSTDGTDTLVYRFGNEATYFEWVAEKIMFTSDTAYKDELKAKIQNYPQTENGYIWSWTTSPWWPTGDGDMHYDGIFRYVSAVYDIVRYENSTSFLEKQCEIGTESGLNGTLGMTVYEKCDLAMSYAMNYLEGGNGVIHLTEGSMLLNDGVTRIDDKEGTLLWNNTGKAGGSASNYWDNLCFGGYDAYETMLFYHALQDMAEIEAILGNASKVTEYANLLSLVHEKFDEYFWNPDTGRYIACIDEDGNKMDFGLTFLNTEALSYGLGDMEKAQCIFSWLDGNRIVEGDDVTGGDILSYTKIINGQRKWYKAKIPDGLYLAPISNTKSIESYTDGGKYWWNDLEGNINIYKKGNAIYGKHLENGGYIFYTVYYELMARAMYQSSEQVANRYAQIAKVYEYNGLSSDENGWLEGLCDEFPESGLAYMPYLYSLMGIHVQNNTLCISPALPSSCTYLGVSDFAYSGQSLSIYSTKIGFAVKASEESLEAPISFEARTDKSYTFRFYDATDALISESSLTATDSETLPIVYPIGTKTLIVSFVIK